MFAGPIGDRLGRKWTILMGSVIFCLGGGLQTGAQGLGYLYAGRLLAGVGYKSHHCLLESHLLTILAVSVSWS